MKIFIDIFKENHKNLFVLILLSLFINIVGVVGAFIFKLLTDDIIPHNLLSQLHILGGSILILYLFNALITYLRYQLILKFSLKIDIKLMKDYFIHVLNLPMNFFDARKSGEILQRFMDTSKIREALSSSTVTLLVDTLMIIIGGVLLYIQSPILLLITIMFIPFFIICSFVLKKPYERYNQKVAENNSELSSYLIESFDGAQTIKSFQSENIVYKKGTEKFNKLISNLLN